MSSEVEEPEREHESRPTVPLVSIIIPTKNAEPSLGRTLESVGAQTYPRIEVIVVDNNSTDRTKGVAAGFPGAKIYSKGPERSGQLNFGASMSHGDYIYRIDQDFILEDKVVEEAVKTCESQGFDAILVHNTSDPTISFWSRVRKLERDCYRDDNTHVAARFFRKAAFFKAGGLDETLTGPEDYDFHNRLLRSGAKIGRIKAQEVHVGEPRNLREVALKHVYYGKHVRAFIRSNPDSAWKQITPFRVAFVRHWRDFLADPKTSLGFLVYQYIRYLAAVAGFIENLL